MSYLLMICRDNEFNVKSYGTGTAVRLPGPTPKQQNVYQFNTPYDDIYAELQEKDYALYQRNGILNMLDRNRKIKKAPQRWQDERKNMFDVVITCEERCFDSVCEDLIARSGERNQIVHVINVNIKDNHQDAVVGGDWILQLCTAIEESEDFHNQMEQIMQKFLEKNPTVPLIYNVHYY